MSAHHGCVTECNDDCKQDKRYELSEKSNRSCFGNFRSSTSAIVRNAVQQCRAARPYKNHAHQYGCKIEDLQCSEELLRRNLGDLRGCG